MPGDSQELICGSDWQEEVYQKIKTMKEMYLPELNEMYWKIVTKLQQHDTHPQPPKSEQLDKLKMFKTTLEHIIIFLQVSKNKISPGFKEKLCSYEKHIVNFINAYRPRKPSMHQGQHPPLDMHSMQQPQSQISRVQSLDNPINAQMQSMNLQGSVGTKHQNNITSLQHNAIFSISGVSTSQQNMINSLHPGTNLDSGQGNTLNSLQQVSVGSQLVRAASPQMPQHPSPQVDQQNKTGTPMQSADSPFVIPLLSASLGPSPMPGDSEKPIFGISSLSNAGNTGHQQTTNAQASPLLAEFTGPDGNHGTALTIVPGKTSVTERPLERLIRAVKSMSSESLSASVSDIGSVVSMTDRIAGSAPGNGSRAAVGEDLVAMNKCCLQARNFIIKGGLTGTLKTRRCTNATPLIVVSSAGSVSDGFKQLIAVETSDLELSATSSIKRPRIQPKLSDLQI